jgi:hypothetical protein
MEIINGSDEAPEVELYVVFIVVGVLLHVGNYAIKTAHEVHTWIQPAWWWILEIDQVALEVCQGFVAIQLL